MQNTYVVLTLLECIPLGIFTVCLVTNRNKRWNILARFICIIALFILNAIQLPIEIALEMPYALTIVIVVIWILNLIFNLESFICEIKEIQKEKDQLL